jgi:hypothetical protein
MSRYVINGDIAPGDSTGREAVFPQPETAEAITMTANISMNDVFFKLMIFRSRIFTPFSASYCKREKILPHVEAKKQVPV